jgi:hypothetical protein
MPRPIHARIAHPLFSFDPSRRLLMSVRRPVYVKRSTAGYLSGRRRRGRSRLALSGADLRFCAEIRHWGRQLRAAGLLQVDKGVWYDSSADVRYGEASWAPAGEVA